MRQPRWIASQCTRHYIKRAILDFFKNHALIFKKREVNKGSKTTFGLHFGVNK